MAEPQINTTAPLRRQPSQKKRIPTFVMVLAFVLVAGLGYVAGGLNDGSLRGDFNKLIGGKELDLSSIQETYSALSKNFDGNLDEQKLIEGANKGLVDAAGDQYTIFMNSEESKGFDDALTGNIGGGIGVEVGTRNNAATVLRLLKDNPAEKAGLAVNDIITKVNGESTEGMVLNDVVTKIRGDVGTSVKLTVNREGVEKEFSITRQQVNNPSAYGEIKDGVGILTVGRFDDNTGSLARAVANDFKDKNVKSVVLDLRGNGGGYVTAAQDLAGIWLNKELVTTERQDGKVTDELKSTGSPILSGIPTVVLVNESSASASEIVAGALHDHKVATLMGATTFGKGSVQKLLNLSDGATLKVTVARWYTPAGVNISKKGITPDKAVVRSADDINAGRDPQLDAALKLF
ncbi:MAG: S41 family peptidase [Candidatus Saccharimonadaceae bacterium]